MITCENIEFIGHQLDRPECVLTTRAGNIYVSDFRGGITHINPQRQQFFYGGGNIDDDGPLKPNGIALLNDGSFLAAHLGDNHGGIYRVTRDHKITPYLISVDNIPLPPTNFVYLDHQQRLWITVSTRTKPRADAYRSDISNGFIVLIDEKGARIVADNIGYTNELYVSPDGCHLFVNATFTRELLHYRISSENSLHPPEVVCQFGHGTFPDGVTMDKNGFLWISSIVSNRLIRVDPNNGQQTVIIEDSDRQFIDWAEQAYQTGSMSRQHLNQVKSKTLRNISSLAFGGPNLSTMYLGCLLGQQLVTINTEQYGATVHGLPPAHWAFDD